MEEKDLLKMMVKEDEKFDKEFSSLSETDRDEIKGNAKIKYLEKYNPAKSKGKQPEKTFYKNICLKNALSDWYVKTTEIKKDENGYPILNEKGKEIRETKIPTVRLNENVDNDADEYEESNLNEGDKTDVGNISIKAIEDAIGIDEPVKEYTWEKLLEKKFRWYLNEDPPKEILKYYLLGDKVKSNGFFMPPFIKKEFKPTKDSIPYPDVPEYYNLSDESKEALRRLKYLKNAENRMWMEMAINEMRQSKEKLEKYMVGWDIEKQMKFRRDTPILSSVILNKKGKYVASCYKGKVERKHTNKSGITKDVTFDNHCEFSLFTDIIEEKNLHLIKDGTLYVTLEPCNKRGFWLDGNKEAPKIPCAVRCVEAGLKKVFIGTKDDNKAVEDKGRAILKSGKYIFKIENRKLVGSEKEVKEEGLLEDYFKAKKYPSEDIGNERIYTIGSPVEEVYDFEADLIEEVRQLNSYFLQRHSPLQFRL